MAGTCARIRWKSGRSAPFREASASSSPTRGTTRSAWSGSTTSRSTRCSTSGGTAGWEWRPTDIPAHRVTAAATWQLPIGRERRFLSDLPTAADAVIGGWQLTPAVRYYSGRLLLFNQSLIVDGDPRVSNPTNDRWFDTSKFRGLQDSFTPRNSPWFWDGLVGPSVFLTDVTLTKMFALTPKYRLEARIEAYNAFNAIVWDNPELNVSSPNFGKVTRKRIDGTGREVQIGLRFIF